MSSTQSNTASLSANEGDHIVKRTTRRSHRKSRAGCKNCKARRIKCDEKKPGCSNCEYRKVRCDFIQPAASPPGHREASGLSSIPRELSISEIELAYHYTTSTCFTLSAWSTGGVFRQNQMAEIGFKNPYVLHLMLAFAAVHLAHYRPHRKEEYAAMADHHYERALVLVTPQIANLNPENSDAILLAEQLICFISWGRGPQPGEYLAFGRDKKSDWLVMFRGIRATFSNVQFLQSDSIHASTANGILPSLPALDVPEEYEKQLDSVMELVSVMSKDTPGYEDDIKAVRILREMYDNRYRNGESEYHVSFGWLYRVTDDFLERLQERGPIPMIIYAHFVVLVRILEQFWYMQGWTHHIMSGIWDLLPREHRAWLEWPIKRIGWVKP
ncbi:hypothetical protein COCC4DRAFT_61961 [Bipolaris maydis ATCC 48331]|uniref:Zn(2)-C6 fungal-type domain-containing protein n=2 Tax=Cochliobolus heterostrophus TaxID=5016 RepID=M2UGJ1_COCH5|nr:uncharacterized protein COCC4DRAFT_61961 [Bipolaris maydis ATCC 48331]EMD87062.1 hypothetical protein COCHEDRAFT_1146102 [Bipolaris maydis C5]KAJ5021617.1 hypothetical protein J3E73DRAFT_402778 [Bipolaris maydis]ENI03945.1 hypothetical protein COCC4DRAFT_61961 [Bipolaris maydis ATCC 48331]KAJ6192891.1 hypothetical protein J3E72DRAFT_252286 [Bipolaris maydis]KAJ6204379.1 hypothetical protein PSV09DRAFT_1146102 [Bipolaris maydis]